MAPTARHFFLHSPPPSCPQLTQQYLVYFLKLFEVIRVQVIHQKTEVWCNRILLVPFKTWIFKFSNKYSLYGKDRFDNIFHIFTLVLSAHAKAPSCFVYIYLSVFTFHTHLKFLFSFLTTPTHMQTIVSWTCYGHLSKYTYREAFSKAFMSEILTPSCSLSS